MSTTEKQVEKVPWIPLILLTIVLAFLAMASYRLLTPQGTQCLYNFGVISQVVYVTVYPYLLLALVYPFRRRLNLSPSILTYIYTAGLAASFTLGFGFHDYVIQFTRHRLYDASGILLNVWWEPPVSAIEAMGQGSVPTDWVVWGPIVFVISLLYISFFFFASSISLIFRRSWLEVEKIPFPLVLSGYELMRVVQTDGGRSYIGKRPFAIGALLGLAFMVPVFMTKTFPWFPDIYGWRSISTCSAWHLPENSPIGSSIIGLASASVDPVSVAIFFLAPLSVTFNVWFWTLIMMALEQVAFYMGYYTGVPSMSGSARLCCSAGVGTGAPFYWPIPSQLGGFLALTLMYIFLRRSYVLETVKLALRRTSNPELERKEAMSYRSMYIMVAIFAIMGVTSLMLLGINLVAAIILLLTTGFTTWFAMTLIFGMAGLGASDLRLWAAGFMRIVWPDPSAATWNLDYAMSHFWAQSGSNQPSYVFGNGYYISAQSLKMANLTGASNRNTFLVSAVCTVISVIVIVASSVWLANLYGTRVMPISGNCEMGQECESNPVAQASRPSIPVYFSYGAAGFIIIALLSVLHARFIWFPLEPIGFIIATSFPGQWFGVWSVCLVAWIAKTIVLRAGGSSLYERHALPIAGGFITGVVLASVMGTVIGMVRFYIPF